MHLCVCVCKLDGMCCTCCGLSFSPRNYHEQGATVHLVCWLDASKSKQWHPFVVPFLSVPDSCPACLFLGQAMTECSFQLSLCVCEILFQWLMPLQSVFLTMVLRQLPPRQERLLAALAKNAAVLSSPLASVTEESMSGPWREERP